MIWVFVQEVVNAIMVSDVLGRSGGGGGGGFSVTDLFFFVLLTRPMLL
jgi:hypothetical protein